MIKAVIVEDEQFAILNLQSLLSEYASDIQLVEVFRSGKEALQKLPGLDFDLLFLDIQFNDDFDAFEMLKAWPFEQLQIIFVTSYNQYAIKAFKYSAIDYLTKPIDKDELIKAITKARARLLKKQEIDQLYRTVRAFRNRQIAIKGQHETVFIPTNQILYLRAEKEYSIVYYLNKQSQTKEIMSSKHLGYWETELSDFPFLRIHKSILINMDQVLSYNTKTLKVANEIQLDIARDRRKDVQNRILSHKTFE